MSNNSSQKIYSLQYTTLISCLFQRLKSNSAPCSLNPVIAHDYRSSQHCLAHVTHTHTHTHTDTHTHTHTHTQRHTHTHTHTLDRSLTHTSTHTHTFTL